MMSLPKDIADAFKMERNAKIAFDAMAPSHQREYLKWIEEAKKDSTRAARIVQLMEKMEERFQKRKL